MSESVSVVAAVAAAVLLALLFASSAAAGTGSTDSRLARCTNGAGTTAPTPAGPYPVSAAGWGPPAGKRAYLSRWAEDWSGMREAGTAPPLKSVPLGGGASLTVGGEARLHVDGYQQAQLQSGDDFEQGLLRLMAGADLRFNEHVRVYSELGAGEVRGRQSSAGANQQNDVSLQQLFVDGRLCAGQALIGVMIGRQEFADAPRQLVSVGDGSNLHRTWNGVRLYAHGRKIRFGAFDFRLTRPGLEAFDEEINRGERLRGVNASIAVAGGKGIYLDPFWLRSENVAFRSGGNVGTDHRDTFGVRLWGRKGEAAFDWTAALQRGEFMKRRSDAWGLFAIQSVGVSGSTLKPRVGVRVDAASGGGAYEAGPLRNFNQLYASSGYLGEGRFLSLSNLLLITPTLSIAPTSATSVSVEYGVARRLNSRDAAYGGQMRPYPGTQNVSGHEIGGLLRVNGSWSATPYVTLFSTYEHFRRGKVLERAGIPSGSLSSVGVTFRY